MRTGDPGMRCHLDCSLFRAVFVLLIAVLPPGTQAQAEFSGEDALALAGHAQDRATPAAVDAIARRIFDRLELPQDVRRRYAFAASASLRKAGGRFETAILDSEILVAAAGVKLGSATKAIVIADGDVVVDVAAGLLVIARGSITVHRETEAGIYLSKGSVRVENGSGPHVYAVRGATVESRSPFSTYNTDTRSAIGAPAMAYSHSRPALFQGEPVRAPAEPMMLIGSGESMPFSGARCSTAVADDVDLHSQMLPYARTRAGCPEIDSAAVRCIQEEDPRAQQPASQELWTLRLCGRPMTLLVQSKRLPGKDPRTGTNLYDHSITVQSGGRAPRAGCKDGPIRTTPHAAEDALALAARKCPAATREQAVRAAERVLEALDLPEERRSRYAYAASASLQAGTDYFEAAQVSEAVLLVDGGVRIAFARNALIVARGDVSIAHGAGLIVISNGSIRLGHESGTLGGTHAPGIYVARGTVDISSSVDPVIYALEGAKPGRTGRATAVNTELRSAGEIGRVTRYSVAALFSGEPPRTPTGRPAPPSAPFSYAGRRCANPLPDEIAFLLRMRAYVTRHAGCETIRSVQADCVQESAAANGFTSVERWTFDLCEREINLVSRVSGYVPATGRSGHGAMAVNSSMVIEPPPPPPGVAAEEERRRARLASMSPEDKARLSALNQAAIAHQRKGELFEAREKYLEARRMSGATADPHANLAGVERQLERSDAATAALTARIEGGTATATTYVERGLLRIRHNDRSRGFRDLDRASELSGNDPGIDAERAWGQLISNRPELAEAGATAVLDKAPMHRRALEVRAWARLFQNRPKEAAADADASLEADRPWTAQAFASDRAGYRVIAGYLARSHAGTRAEALRWLGRWRPLLAKDAWPDALALYLLGEIDEARMKAVAASTQPADRGNATGEGLALLALDRLPADERKQRAGAMLQFFRTEFAAGHSLAYVAYVHATRRK
jgi:hypothetical protein